MLEIEKEELTLSQTYCTIFEPVRCSDNSEDRFVFSTEEQSSTCFEINTGIVPKASVVSGPCVLTDAQNIAFDVGGSLIAFSNTRLFINQNERSISGTLLGFISEESAAKTDIDGDPLSLFLRGSGQACARGNDRGENDVGTKGWWFVFEFKTEPVEVFTREGCGCESTRTPVSFFAMTAFLLFILVRKKTGLIV